MLPDGYVPYSDIGFAYKVHDAQISWPVARQECIFEGGNLAVIDSYRKFRYVSAQRRSNGYTHVGIVRMYDDESWTNVKTGKFITRMKFTVNQIIYITILIVNMSNYSTTLIGACVSEIPWANNEPYGNWDCVGIKQSEGGLANYNCKLRADFICEIPITENYNLLMSRLASAAIEEAPIAN